MDCDFNELDLLCKRVREQILLQICEAGSGHVGGSLSIVEVLVVLYKIFMKNIDPKNPKKEGRDRLVLSKGHAGPAIYAVLSIMGYFSHETLLTLNKNGTSLPSHCDMNKTPGIDMTTGSLGQGLSCAVGMAISSKLKKDNAIIYSILGDGELQEGQIWEASMYASFCKLENLIVFIDYNKAQIDGTVQEICDLEPLDTKWEAFGWNTLVIDNGNSCKEIYEGLSKIKKCNQPTVIILKTIKGYGVDFAQKAGIANHSMSVTQEMVSEFLAQSQ